MLFMPHLPHSVLGFQLNARIPRSHHIIDAIKFGEDEEAAATAEGRRSQMGFDDVREAVRVGIVRVFGDIFDQIQVTIRLYFLTSLLCNLLDIIVLCYTLTAKFGTPEQEDSSMILLALCFPFLSVNLSWLS